MKILSFEEWLERNPEVLEGKEPCKDCKCTGRERCPECRGTGECPECGRECLKCDGEGTVECHCGIDPDDSPRQEYDRTLAREQEALKLFESLTGEQK